MHVHKVVYLIQREVTALSELLPVSESEARSRDKLVKFIRYYVR